LQTYGQDEVIDGAALEDELEEQAGTLNDGVG
jgi:hypothetical protein